MILKVSEAQILAKLSHFEALVLLDVGPTASYDCFHLPRAISIPVEMVDRLAPSYLPDRGRKIVVYDNGDRDGADAWNVARRLDSLGYVDLFVYEGGRREWIEDGQRFEVHINPAPATTNPCYSMSLLSDDI